MKLASRMWGMAVAPQEHCLVYPFRPLITTHEDTATQPGQDAKGANVEAVLVKPAQTHCRLHFAQVPTDLVEVAEGEEQHISQDGG